VGLLSVITSLYQVPDTGKEVILMTGKPGMGEHGRGDLMTSLVIVVALTAFLVGVATAVFLMLCIGIRKGDRPERIVGTRNTGLDSSTRSVIGSGTWPSVPVYRADRKDD
jgi:hypothetical protein